MITPEQKIVALQKAKEWIVKIDDPMHSVPHMEQTFAYAMDLAVSYPEADRDILEIAVWWHDVGRVFLDDGHAQKSAEMAGESLGSIGIDPGDVAKICAMIESHSNSSTTKPASLEAIILKDADKLDFLTVSRWQIGIGDERSKEINIGISKIPAIGREILKLPESKIMYEKLFVQLVKYLKTADNAFINNLKPRIREEWKVEV
ncbi:MAG: HD domain-containing protein [Patescibacteria group bacterium]|jgi:HD superfamily phosphodiesterase